MTRREKAEAKRSRRRAKALAYVWATPQTPEQREATLAREAEAREAEAGLPWLIRLTGGWCQGGHIRMDLFDVEDAPEGFPLGAIVCGGCGLEAWVVAVANRSVRDAETL